MITYWSHLQQQCSQRKYRNAHSVSMPVDCIHRIWNSRTRCVASIVISLENGSHHKSKALCTGATKQEAINYINIRTQHDNEAPELCLVWALFLVKSTNRGFPEDLPSLGVCNIFFSVILGINTLRHIGRHFADDIFKCIFKNKNVLISIRI